MRKREKEGKVGRYESRKEGNEKKERKGKREGRK